MFRTVLNTEYVDAQESRTKARTPLTGGKVKYPTSPGRLSKTGLLWLLREWSRRIKQYLVVAKSVMSPHSFFLSFLALPSLTCVPWIDSSINTLPQLLLSGASERLSTWLSKTYCLVSGYRYVKPLKTTWKDIFLLPQIRPSKSMALRLLFHSVANCFL